MAEYIEREALIDAIEGINWYKYNDEGRLTQGGTSHDKMFLPYTAVEGTIKSAPAADVRPVVFCKDCKWYQIDELKKDGTEDRRYKPSVCVLAEQRRDPNHFCADGEKREES